MLENFNSIRELLLSGPKRTVAIATAADEEVQKAARIIEEDGLAEVILVCESNGAIAALKAAKLVRNGKADVLMKGFVNTGDFLRAVLDKENGIRGKGILSHLAAFETPGQKRLIIMTDGGMNLCPTLEEKVKILDNAVKALHKLGLECPKVAALCANEVVNPKLPSSIDAAALKQLNIEGEIAGCIVEGPIAFDVAISAEAAKHKNIESRIAGKTDLFLVPGIDSGNIMGKVLMSCAGAKMAGVVLGADAPIVLASRSDNAESKLNSLALACALIDEG